jgi:hypothetical protein
MKPVTAIPVPQVPQPANILTAIQQMASRSAVVWTLIDDYHPSCDATWPLLEAALECQPATMEEALFLLVVANVAVHKAENGQAPRCDLRKVRTALYNAVDFMTHDGIKVCPLVREYYMPACNHPQLGADAREAMLVGNHERSNALARDVLAQIGGAA